MSKNKFKKGQKVSHNDAATLVFEIIDVLPSVKKSDPLYICKLVDGTYKQVPPSGWKTAEEIAFEMTFENLIKNNTPQKGKYKLLQVIHSYAEADLSEIVNVLKKLS